VSAPAWNVEVGEAIVETLLEAFTRHQHLAICHRLRQRAEVAA